jgi:hypothetical protein
MNNEALSASGYRFRSRISLIVRFKHYISTLSDVATALRIVLEQRAAAAAAAAIH